MDWPTRFLQHRVHEELAWLREHVDVQTTEAEAMAYLRSQCGWEDGTCRYVASEYCELDCPFKED